MWVDRELLDTYGCEQAFKKVFPKDPDLRKGFYEIFSIDPFLQSNYEMYNRPAVKLTAISANCQLYVQMGCAFVSKIDSSIHAKENWMKHLSINEDKIKSDYMQPIQEILEFVSEYTGAQIIPCSIMISTLVF